MAFIEKNSEFYIIPYKKDLQKILNESHINEEIHQDLKKSKLNCPKLKIVKSYSRTNENMRFCERDSSGTTVATEWRSHEGAKVMERIARRERPKGAKRLAQIQKK